MINRRDGFSIIELVVVVVIIALMSLASLAIFRNYRQTISVKTAARDVASIMRLARRKAVTEREDYLAVYDCNNKTIWVQSYSTYTTSGKNPDVGTEQALPARAVIDNVTGAEGSDPYYHIFTPKSTKSGASGGVYLWDEKKKIKYRVTVINTTARARIYSYWED